MSGSERPKTEARAWQRMLSGRRLDLLNPSPLDIELSDIAHGLARVARWNGQTNGDHAFSVAQHSLVVEAIFRRQNRCNAQECLMALLHDAPEYVIGDMISPVKSAVGPGYAAMEARLAAAIHTRFGLPAILPDAVKRMIKRADRVSAWLEATRIAGFSREEATKFFRPPPPGLVAGLDVALRPPAEARTGFTARHARLIALMDGRPA